MIIKIDLKFNQKGSQHSIDGKSFPLEVTIIKIFVLLFYI